MYYRDKTHADAVSMNMKVRDAIRLVKDDGWVFKSQVGSHRHFVHPVKPGKVTIAGHPSVEVAVGTMKSILQQAGIK